MTLDQLSPETQAAILRGYAHHHVDSAEYWLRFDDYARALEDLERATQYFREADAAAAETRSVFE